MPAIPEFVLRKLYVPGSLTACDEGFSFQLNNTLAPVTLTGFAIIVDEHQCDPQKVSLRLPRIEETAGAAITGEQPFKMAVNTNIGLNVRAPMPRKKLVIRVNTREAGVLQFSIPVKSVEPKSEAKLSWTNKVRHAIQSILRAWQVSRDPQHPRFHFTPPSNWMNDPNGLIYWKNTYHMFYQYNPYEAVWGNIHWGHASSKDLLHWKHHPLALSPDSEGADAGGCFSGCAVDDGGTATIIYTGVFPEMQVMAKCSADDLVTWKKHPYPLISSPPEGMKVEGFRDPCVWKEDYEWRMAVGSGIPDQGGAVLLYSSPNLIDWQYLGILYQKDLANEVPVQTCTMWECPSFFPMGEKWVLILSACSASEPISTIYYIGDYRDNRFTAHGPARILDHGAGACFYAPLTFLGPGGERLMFGWLREARSTDEMKRAGWSGSMSLPRVLSLSEEGELVCAPLPGTAMLRIADEALDKAGQFSRRVSGVHMEILVHVQEHTQQWSGIHLIPGKASDEPILIGYDSARHEVVVDCQKAGGLFSSLPFEIPLPGELRLHIFVDGSVLEVFVNDRQAISARFYIQEPQALRVQLQGEAQAELWAIREIRRFP